MYMTTPKFTEVYKKEINLCKSILIHIAHSEYTKDLKISDTRKLLENFFSKEVISQAIIQTLYGE